MNKKRKVPEKVKIFLDDFKLGLLVIITWILFELLFYVIERLL